MSVDGKRPHILLAYPVLYFELLRHHRLSDVPHCLSGRAAEWQATDKPTALSACDNGVSTPTREPMVILQVTD
jgi:hypothetical protein